MRDAAARGRREAWPCKGGGAVSPGGRGVVSLGAWPRVEGGKARSSREAWLSRRGRGLIGGGAWAKRGA